MNFCLCCVNCDDYTIIEEGEDRYICICNICGSEFTRWK